MKVHVHVGRKRAKYRRLPRKHMSSFISPCENTSGDVSHSTTQLGWKFLWWNFPAIDCSGGGLIHVHLWVGCWYWRDSPFSPPPPPQVKLADSECVDEIRFKSITGRKLLVWQLPLSQAGGGFSWYSDCGLVLSGEHPCIKVCCTTNAVMRSEGMQRSSCATGSNHISRPRSLMTESLQWAEFKGQYTQPWACRPCTITSTELIAVLTVHLRLLLCSNWLTRS